jgi:hypothetical protein
MTASCLPRHLSNSDLQERSAQKDAASISILHLQLQAPTAHVTGLPGGSCHLALS